jgi:hypothetical protein
LQTSLAVVVADVVVADVVVTDVVVEADVEVGADEVVEVVEVDPLTATILCSRTALIGDSASTYILNTSS